MPRRSHLLLLLWACLICQAARAEDVTLSPLGAAVERQLPSDVPFMQWSQDPKLLETQSGDKLEQKQVVTKEAQTVKLKNLVPPIHFESGVADIPPSYVSRLRSILDGMRDLKNVRLHLVGHADSQPLSGALAERYGDNAGLSRERAGQVAEFLKTALGLPPEAISFEWAGATQPIASNATPEGRAKNRRVEVEVWYDKIGKKAAVEDVVVPQEIKRVKVCRMETVCKLRYREGQERRARVKNLIAPLHFSEEAVHVSDEFVQQVDEALKNLRDRQNVTVKFIGYTDDAPLAGRTKRIYGTHLALSKAMAYRVALAVQDALHLPTSAIESDGRGATLPVAPNASDRGRALNRRVEVEFWYDDPLEELPDEPQMCPDAAGAEVVTKVYDPPWGPIEPLRIENGQPVIPAGYADTLRRAMKEAGGKDNVRLRFVGYTGNERLDRRTAIVYDDDVGLSVSRARRTMEKIQAQLGLSDAQVEHEGRGFVQSNDVVNAGFLEGDDSYVVVQVVYDEPALLDNYEGVEVTPITREVSEKDPLDLNLMRISVDGKPIDDPGRSSADVQRCTDVALDRANIQLRFDDLHSDQRLSVTSQPTSIRVPEASSASTSAPTVRFKMYTNYSHFIKRAEVRIFDRNQSVRAKPLAVVEVGADGTAEWHPAAEWFAGPVRELKYVLRAYDEQARFDETSPQSLWMIHGEAANQARIQGNPPARPGEGAPKPPTPSQQRKLLAGYGESELAIRNIPLGSTGTVEVHGSGVPPQHTVWVAGQPVPVDEQGNFVAESILPSGTHTVEVAVLDPKGNGELFLRDLALEKNDWFYVGMADLTLGANKDSGPIDALVGANAPYDNNSIADGRLAFYLSGKFAEDWKLKASADTREEPVKNLFSNFLDKSPQSLLRRIDPEYYYPTYGDDSTVVENAPTSGKFFVELSERENHALWGNFKLRYLENELAQVDRGLYGANLHYQSPSTTSFGEKRLVVDGFAAQPGTVPSREEFRGTGGSLYFLRRQDLLAGSERVRIEMRDKDSGLVTGVVDLRPSQDYDIDYLQGRIMLSEPVGSIVDDNLLVRSSASSGDEAWLVVQYEYTPGFGQVNALAAGGEGQYWLGDFLKLGVTANRNDDSGTQSSLYGADLTLRKSAQSWVKLQAGRTQGLVSSSLRSVDGGFQFQNGSALSGSALGGSSLNSDTSNAGAYRVDISLDVADFINGARGRLTLYGQRRDAGYSAPGMATLTDTDQFGGTFDVPVTKRLHVRGKEDRLIQKNGLKAAAQEVDIGYQLTDRWSMSTGVRNESRKDSSPVVPVTQVQGDRTDAVLQVGYDSLARWRSYGFAQATLAATGDRKDNRRVGVGGAYRVNKRLALNGEVSEGDLGPAAKVGTSYQVSDRTNLYLNYALDNEEGNIGPHGRRGSLVTGARSRLSDSASVYVENRYQHAPATGLTEAVGMTLTPTDRWSFSGNWETGTLTDRLTSADTKRNAGGVRLGYNFQNVQISSGMEYRYDDAEQPDGSKSKRTTWLFRNSLKLKLSPEWRLLGSLDHSFSRSSLGQFYDGGYTKAVLGYAYRPVGNDRLNALAKYTYFYNVPTADQLSVLNTPAEFVQRSHIASLDVMYDLTANWSVGGKYAYRLGQVSLDRQNLQFFDNSAHLAILRNDWRFFKNWEASAEGRMLDLPDLKERRSGALVTLYRYLGDHFKVGVGYNFTDFSDDLTDLSYDHHGVFFNLVGTL